LNKITGLDKLQLEVEIQKYIDQTRSNHEGFGKLGSFEGTKVELARTVVLESWNLDEIDQLIKDLIQKALDLAFD
jgi:hypothetical protein